jgi:adenosylmethionine-8-amino-7-oxononanoate aminotransferase
MHSNQLRQWDNDHVWHPFAAMSAYRDDGAPIIADADGFFLIDVDGNKLLDGYSSLWCNVHGHRVPEIDSAVHNQLDRVAHCTMLGAANIPAIELARQLVERTPDGLNKVFYSDSGSTAVEVALKIAYQYQVQKPDATGQRDLFLCMGDAYHGDTIGSVSVGGMSVFHATYGDLLFKTLKLPPPVTFRVPDGYDADRYITYCFDELERVVRKNHERVAAFVIEPLVQGAAGILVHADGYLRRVRKLTAEHDIPLIVDEVAVGFGRTGTLFACEQEQVCPDLMCLAKGISGGYLPVAATLATDEIYDAFLGEPADGKTFYHGHTYTGNPLGCAASLASLKLFDENRVLDNVQKISQRMQTRLAELQSHPHVGEVRQKGIMVGVELVRDRDGNDPFPAASRVGHQVILAARRRGVMLRPLGDVIVLMPAPAMPVELVEQLCDAVIESIDEVTT